MAQRHTTEKHFKRILAEMPEHLWADWTKFGHKAILGGHADKILIAYSLDDQRQPVDINRIRINDIQASSTLGLWCELENLETEQLQMVGHSPHLLMDLPIFIYVPLRVEMRWELRVYQGRKIPVLTSALMAKTHNDPKFANSGNYYVESPGAFLARYPKQKLEIPEKRLTN